jgi:hypothetical protein
MDYNHVGRCLGGIYIALCSALTDEGAQLAHEHLHQLSESPHIRPEDRRVYQIIFDCATRPIEEQAAEVYANEFAEQKRGRFEVIQGGSPSAA